MDFGVNCDMTHDKDVIDLLIIHSPDSPDALIVYLALSYINRYLTVYYQFLPFPSQITLDNLAYTIESLLNACD